MNNSMECIDKIATSQETDTKTTNNEIDINLNIINTNNEERIIYKIIKKKDVSKEKIVKKVKIVDKIEIVNIESYKTYNLENTVDGFDFSQEENEANDENKKNETSKNDDKKKKRGGVNVTCSCIII